MPNLFSAKSPEFLAALAAHLVDVAGDDPHYAFTQAEMQALTAAQGSTQAAISNQQAAVLQEKAATQAKKAGKAALVAKLNVLAAQAYANASLTDEQLVAVGFSPRRSTVPRPAVATPVTGLKATPATDGSVRLAWERSGNSKAATFTIEASADGASWTIVAATPRVSLTLDGFAPGATAYFRVTAINASVASRPSATVGIYLPASSAVRLRVA